MDSLCSRSRSVGIYAVGFLLAGSRHGHSEWPGARISLSAEEEEQYKSALLSC